MSNRKASEKARRCRPDLSEARGTAAAVHPCPAVQAKITGYLFHLSLVLLRHTGTAEKQERNELRS